MAVSPRLQPQRLVIAVAAALAALVAQAQEAAPSRIVVTATRTANPLDQVPASISVVGEEDFADVQAGNIADAMKRLPNVNFGGGPRVNGEIPTLRGYQGASIALSVDGARQNDVTSPGLRSPLYVDPYFLKQVEVLRGSASSLYGSGGNGGAMAFTTLSARDLLASGQTWGAGFKAGYAEADLNGYGNARVYGGNDTFDGLLALSYRDWDRIAQGGDTVLSPNQGHSDSALIKLGAQAVAARFEFSHQIYDSQNFEPRNPQADVTLPGSPLASLDHIKQSQSVLRATSLGNGPLSYAATVYDTDLEATYDQGANAIAAPRATFETQTTGGSVQASYAFGTSQRVTAGVDNYRSKQSATSAGLPNPVNPDGSQEATGFFVQDEIALGGQWRLTPSVRYDRYETTAAASGTTASANHTSPKIALAWLPLPGLMVYGNYGESFRAPTLGEMYSEISGTNYFMNFRPNTALKPEVDKTYELGGSFARRGLIASGDAARLRVAVFDGKAEDMISSTVVGSYTRTAPFVGTGFVLQSQNVTSATRRGAEIEAGYDIGAWRSQLAYSRVRVTNADTGAGLFSPPDKLNLRLRWQAPIAGLSLLLNCTGVAAQDYDATALRRRPGYATHDLFATWMPADHKYRVDVGVANFTDKRYADYQSSMAYAYVHEAGRSFRASFGMEF